MSTEIASLCETPGDWYRHDRRYRAFEEAKERIGPLLSFFEPRHSKNGHTIQNHAGKEVVNFSGYDYLSLVGRPEIRNAACAAIETYGSSAGASRLVSGETPLHAELEARIAGFLGVERALTFVSGHGANVTTIGFLFGKNDLILHDAYIHNSVLEGIRLSGAERWSFAHNDIQDLEAKLQQAGDFKRVVVVVEGVYSMDGDVPDLAAIVALRGRHHFILMVDEAHSLGTIGPSGRGLAEQHGVPAGAVNIWMGTLSKALVSCGGYVAGDSDFIDFLRYNCPGFVFSTGLPPANAAAALAALDILERSPELVQELREKSLHFQSRLIQAGLDIGTAGGTPVFPVFLPQEAAIGTSCALRVQGINVFPIIYPAVPKSASRVRFFLNRDHSLEQINRAVDVLGACVSGSSLPRLLQHT